MAHAKKQSPSHFGVVIDHSHSTMVNQVEAKQVVPQRVAKKAPPVNRGLRFGFGLESGVDDSSNAYNRSGSASEALCSMASEAPVATTLAVSSPAGVLSVDMCLRTPSLAAVFVEQLSKATLNRFCSIFASAMF